MSAGPAPPDEQVDSAPEQEEGATFDPFEHVMRGKRERGSARTLPQLIRGAASAAYTASPRLFVTTFGLQLVTAGLLAAQVYLGKVALQAIFQANSGHSSFGSALPGLIGLLAATGVASFATGMQMNVQRLLGERVVRITWRSILDVTTSVDLATFESPSFFDDLQRIQANALVRPLTLIQGLVALVGGVVAVVGLSLALLAIAPVVLPILLFTGIPLSALSRVGGRLEFAFQLAQTTASRMRYYLIELLIERDHAKEVRAFGLRRYFRERWEQSYAAYFGDLNVHVRRLMRVAAISSLSSILVLSVAVGLILYLVAHHHLTLAAAGAAIIAVRALSQQVQTMFTGITELFECTLYLQDLENFRARAPAERALADGTPARADDVGPLRRLTVEGLSYRYPEGKRLALTDVSLDIEEGQVVALVGENGSGKTTLAKLIAGLLQPTQGTVRWNGRDVSTLDQREFARHVAVIFQDFVKYAFPARDNVAIGDIDRAADEPAIRAAARRAGADDVLARLPEGYDTLLGRIFGGVDLSIGQWQRVAIARAFFRDARLLILDEPTSALDPRAEAELFDRVRELAGGRTVLLISHRFSTVRSADQIIVLHHGAIEESGTHDELFRAGGRYAELFELQARAYR